MSIATPVQSAKSTHPLEPFLIPSVLFVSVLQAGWFSLQQVSIYQILGVALALINILAAAKFILRKWTGSWAAILILYSVQVTLFIFLLINAKTSPQLLQTSILLAHLAIGTSIILNSRKALLFSALLALVLFILELTLYSHAEFEEINRARGWSSANLVLPDGASVYVPHSERLINHFDNSGNNEHRLLWWLRTEGGNQANFVFLSSPVRLRVSIVTTKPTPPYDLQLNYSPFRVEARKRYRLEFMARADKPRKAFVGFARAHGDWNGLGLYNSILLDSNWKQFEMDFIASSNDDNARIHFDLAENDTSLELAKVTFNEAASESNNILYRFNMLGCRGADFLIPKPSGMRRILVLGDASAMGVGIQEDLTFTSRLQTLFNDQHRDFEVINCAISGFTLKEARWFYESTVRKYQPDYVIFAATLANTYPHIAVSPRRRTLQLLPLTSTWLLFQLAMHSNQSSETVEEIRAFSKEAGKNGAQFHLLILRDNNDFSGRTMKGRLWNQLEKSIHAISGELQIPVIDPSRVVHRNRKAPDIRSKDPSVGYPNEVAHEIFAIETMSFFSESSKQRNKPGTGS